MKDRRALLAVIIGLGALVVGVVTAVAEVAWLGAVAGVLGLGAGAISVAIACERDRSTATSKDLEEEIAKLESAVAAQVQARLTAEEAVKSLGRQLSAAERRTVEVAEPTDERGDRIDILHDDSTGLFSERYFRVAVDARIASARRHLRPVAVALLDLVLDARSEDPRRAPAEHVADAIDATLREADTACRLEDGRFALVLEDTPESGAIWTVERIRRAIAKTSPDITMWAGIACYPAHAFDAAAVVERANRALISARDWHQDRIEVATVE